MTALSTRDALAEGLHALACTRHPRLSGCDSAVDYIEDAAVLIASGAVVDATTLADDEALVERFTARRTAAFGMGYDDHNVEASRDYLRHLAAALTERGDAA